MLSEEALILVVVAGAFVLLVLGVLELIWPTGPRHPARRAQARETPPRPVEAVAFPRPSQSVVRPRPYEAVTPLRPPGAVVFPPPPRYVDPPRRPEPAVPRATNAVAPARPIEPVAPRRPEEEAVPRPVDHVAPPPPLEPTPAPPLAVAAPVSSIEDVAPDVAPPEPPDVAPSGPTDAGAPPRPAEPVTLQPAEPIAPQQIEPIAPQPTESVAPEPAEHVTPPPAEHPAPPARRRRRSKVSPHARPHGVLRGQKTQADRGVDPATTDRAPVGGAGTGPTAAGPPTRTWSGLPEPPAPEARLTRDSPLVETCFALYQEKRFSEVVSIGEETLAKLPVESPATPSHETAALWSVVGLAKQGLGDDDGARAALESALDVALDGERATYRRHLATLALDAAQSRLARAGGHDAGDRVATTRTAIAWTERGLAAVPFDPALSDARERAYEALWEGYEQAATALLQRQEFRGARQLLREALDDPALPAARAAGFRGLLSGTFGGEIGQLTAQAILGMQEGRESEALESLQRAEELLATIPAEALPSSRREEVDQRLWWGYAELGSRRLEAGDYEEALDPLIHALRFESIGPERQAETRGAVVRALEGIAAVRALSVRRLIDAGLRDEAVQSAEKLRTLVNGSRDLGLTENELLAAFARVRRLCEELGMEDPA